MTPHPVIRAGSITVSAVDGIPEVAVGADLADLVVTHVGPHDGDVLVVTSKVVSKAEGQVRALDRETAIDQETVRVVARRGPTQIVQNRLGLVMAAAGVDASNVAAGSVVLLPRDPDASARTLRKEILRRTGHNVAVIVSDTSGRAWRNGQTDIAIGVAGMLPVEDLAGAVDAHGNTLAVTAPAVADEIAGIAELATGKTGARPVTVLRGLGDRVLPAGEHGPGAVALQRDLRNDMFALGAREAVVAALAGTDEESFGLPATSAELTAALVSCGYRAEAGADDSVVVGATTADPVLGALLRAHRWESREQPPAARPHSAEPHLHLVPLP